MEGWILGHGDGEWVLGMWGAGRADVDGGHDVLYVLGYEGFIARREYVYEDYEDIDRVVRVLRIGFM